jgi:glycine cleavage system aminomethyltransferase T
MSSYAIRGLSRARTRLVKATAPGQLRRDGRERRSMLTWRHAARCTPTTAASRCRATSAIPRPSIARLREGVAIYDLGFRTLVRAIGADRVSFLQGMLTNDVTRLDPGATGRRCCSRSRAA